MSGFGLLEMGALGVAAVFVGFAKTAIGGVASLSVAVFAAVLPARESTGALLLLLLVGDLFALHAYRRHADWPALLRLFPSVAAGIVFGALFVGLVDDTVMRRTIGGLLLAIVAAHVWQRRRGQTTKPPEDTTTEPAQGRRRPASLQATALVYGTLAGFTTMVANAGGSVMSLYLLSSGLAMLGFLGTAAWFFFIVNVFKLPFSVGLGLITTQSLILDAALAVGVVLGALLGRAVVRRLDQTLFERLVLAFTVLSSLNLVR